jgi:hypothetical protein
MEWGRKFLRNILQVRQEPVLMANEHISAIRGNTIENQGFI